MNAAAAMKPMRGMRGITQAVAMFTIAPVPRSWHRAATPTDARATVPWLPAIGAAVGALSGLVAAAVLAADRGATVLAAALAVAALAVAVRALHWDGLADTADGLGSGRPATEALAVMHRSDIGPFGVLAIVLVMLVNVGALARIEVDGIWCATSAVAVAAATGRLAVVQSCTRRVPAARPGGFGALVVGATTPLAWVVHTAAVLGFGAGVAALTPHAHVLAWPCAQSVALVLGWAFRAHAVRRFGGVTGDVFGAIVELVTAATLVGLAVT